MKLLLNNIWEFSAISNEYYARFAQSNGSTTFSGVRYDDGSFRSGICFILYQY